MTTDQDTTATYEDDDDIPTPHGALTGDIDPAVIDRNTREAIEKGGDAARFPNNRGARAKLYRRDLIGVRFLIVSPPVFRTRPAHTYNGRRFDQQKVVLFWVRVRGEDGKPKEAQLAELNGEYLINRARDLGAELVVTRWWTVARCPELPENEQWGFPFVLATWDGDEPDAEHAERQEFPPELERPKGRTRA